MKKVVVLIALVFLTISLVSASDVILRLSADTNAHGEIWNGTNYGTNISYFDIFGVDAPVDANTCDGNNTILKLSSDTNAHAEGPAGTDYNTEVCFGNLQCSLVTGECPPGAGETCVVKLSDTTNAHLETCDNSNYGYSICCVGGGGGMADCESLETKNDCWTLGNNCTWTPPGTSTNPDGGCCPDGEFIWNKAMGTCDPSFVEICNDVWAVDNQIPGTTYQLSGGTYQYCAQITSGLSYGWWYDINKF